MARLGTLRKKFLFGENARGCVGLSRRTKEQQNQRDNVVTVGRPKDNERALCHIKVPAVTGNRSEQNQRVERMGQQEKKEVKAGRRDMSNSEDASASKDNKSVEKGKS